MQYCGASHLVSEVMINEIDQKLESTGAMRWAGALNRTRPSHLSALAAAFKPNIGD